MTQQTILNGDTGLEARTKLNENFAETYAAVPDHVAEPNPHPQYLTETEADTLYAPINSAGGLSGEASISITKQAGAYEWSETVAAVGISPTSRIFLGLGAATDDDENCAELLDMISCEAIPGTDEITINAAFLQPTSGPILFNWSAS